MKSQTVQQKRRLPLFVALLILTAAVPVAAGVGSIGVFSDAVGGDCNITDAAGLVRVEVVLVGSDGTSHVSFRIEESAGLGMTYAQELIHFGLKTGDVRAGIQITFGACLSGPVHLATIFYTGTGTTSACEAIQVMPHPAVGSVRIYDCFQNPFTTPRGGGALVRNDGGCACSTAIELSTWGRVKSLYQ